MRQLLTESLLLAFIGGALGIVVGYWGKPLLPPPANQAAVTDWRVLAFVLGVTALTGIVFGIAPALRATRVNVSDALKQTGRSVVGSRSALGKSLLVVQVAVSLMLLVGAGLFLRTLHNLRQVDVGFNPQNLLLFRINPTLNRYDEKRQIAMYTQLLERIAIGAGRPRRWHCRTRRCCRAASTAPVFSSAAASIPTGQRDFNNSINRLVISTNFFEMMEIPIVLGRGFSPRGQRDRAESGGHQRGGGEEVFPEREPDRPAIRIERRDDRSARRSSASCAMPNTTACAIRPRRPCTCRISRRRTGSAVIEVRTAGDPASVTAGVREAVRQIEPNLPMMDVSTQLEQVERRFAQEKIFAQAYTLFGGLALLVASIGLFGLMSYAVSRRTNEIGIRMALGAQRGAVMRQVLVESMVLVAIGVAIGVAGSLGAGRFVSTLLFGLAPTDAMTIVAATAVMIAVSALAGFLPARRASRVDPMVALRYD